ncbi:hypothetical protein GJ496_002297 [Pomphorhynchus laevis]|nr:hypothetical protein GJ496_002297 [Pomphorhynchus laevis]
MDKSALIRAPTKIRSNLSGGPLFAGILCLSLVLIGVGFGIILSLGTSENVITPAHLVTQPTTTITIHGQPQANSIASEIVFNSTTVPSYIDKALLQQILCIKLNDVAQGAPFYIEVDNFQTDKQTFPVKVYYDKDTDCSQVDCGSYFDKLKGIKLKNDQVKYTVSLPVDIATNQVPVPNDEWPAFEATKANCETFNTKIEATCDVTDHVAHFEHIKSLQKTLCGILAETENLPGAPFFMEHLGSDSTAKKFPITIYYKLPETCAGGVCDTFISDNLKDIELNSEAKCTVSPSTGIQLNRVPVRTIDFITDQKRNECETSNYEFKDVKIKIEVDAIVVADLKDATQELICALLAENPTDNAFYVEVGTLVFDSNAPANNQFLATIYCKGTDNGEECVTMLKNTFEFQISKESGAPISLKQWSDVVTKRNNCSTTNKEIQTIIKISDHANVAQGDSIELQKALCSKLKTVNNVAPYYINIVGFNQDLKEFNATLYYKHVDGIDDCMNKGCDAYLDENFKEIEVSINGKELVYTVTKPMELDANLNKVNAGKWIEVELRKKECNL